MDGMTSSIRKAFIALVFLCYAGPLRAQAPVALRTPSTESALDQVAFIHGAAGPFAVAGYRMGERALKELEVSRATFSLEAIHKTPNEVQWSCVADGVQAATGVSVGKLNLRLEKVPQSAVETIVRDRKSGKTLLFKLKPEFVKRYLNLPYEDLPQAGKEVISLTDEEIFSVSASRS